MKGHICHVHIGRQFFYKASFLPDTSGLNCWGCCAKTHRGGVLDGRNCSHRLEAAVQAPGVGTGFPSEGGKAGLCKTSLQLWALPDPWTVLFLSSHSLPFACV